MNTKPFILIVEDDQKLRSLIVKYLSQSYNTYSAGNCKEAFSIISTNKIDLICLDITLPDGSGLDICKEIKKRRLHIKVIVLSKKTSIEDRVKVFNLGADDYLPKPFFFQELKARADRLLNIVNNTIVNGRYSLDLDKGFFKYERDGVQITKLQTLIMISLINCHKKYCTISDITYRISQHILKPPSDDSIKVNISRMKCKFKKILGREIIGTKYGYGYYLKDI